MGGPERGHDSSGLVRSTPSRPTPSKGGRTPGGSMSRSRLSATPSSASRPSRSLFGSARLTERGASEQEDWYSHQYGSFSAGTTPHRATQATKESVQAANEHMAAPLINKYGLRDMMSGVCSGHLVPTGNKPMPLNKPLLDPRPSPSKRTTPGLLGASNLTYISKGMSDVDIDSDASSDTSLGPGSFLGKATEHMSALMEASALRSSGCWDRESRPVAFEDSGTDPRLSGHKMYHLQQENVRLKKELRLVRDGERSIIDAKEEMQCLEEGYRDQLNRRDRELADVQASNASLSVQIRTLTREVNSLKSRNLGLEDERESLLLRMDQSAQPIIQQMDKIVKKLREDFNDKVDECMVLRDEKMVLQVDARQKAEKIAFKDSEIEALNKQIATLRDYVVSLGAGVAPSDL